MRQRAIILIIVILLAGDFSFCQEASNAENKKPRFCYVELKRIDKTVEKFILAGFSGDSIIGFVTKNMNKKIIHPDKTVAIKAVDIKNVHMQIVKHVGFPDSTNSLNSADISIDDFDSVLRQREFGYALGSAITDALTSATFIPAVWSAGFFFMDILFAPRGRSYFIKGNQKRFFKMADDFKPAKETNDITSN
jgi:hypothetical protein